MQAVVRTLIILLVGGSATGCPAHDPGNVDAQTIGGNDGSNTNQPGLSVRWSTKVPVPGNVKDDLTVTSMLYRMQSFSIIGDAGSPMLTAFQIDWSEGHQPPLLTFADAPTGVYSKIAVLADGNLINYSYEIYGTVKVAGETHNYKIHDRSPVGISLDTSVQLEPGDGAQIDVELDMAQAFDGLDWTMLSNDNGTLELDTFDDQMGDFRSRMATHVFDVDGVQTN